MVVSIKEKLLKIKPLLAPLLEKEAYFIVTLLVLVSGGAFAAGRMAPATSGSSEGALALHPIMRTLPGRTSSTDQGNSNTSTTSASEPASAVTSKATAETKGIYVGSRKGSKYHLPSCSGALHISAANKVWFTSKEDAASKGYTPASNCKGI